MSQKITFDLTCGCGANNQHIEELDGIIENNPATLNCSQCQSVLVFWVSHHDKEMKVIDYTVQLRKSIIDPP